MDTLTFTFTHTHTHLNALKHSNTCLSEASKVYPVANFKLENNLTPTVPASADADIAAVVAIASATVKPNHHH